MLEREICLVVGFNFYLSFPSPPPNAVYVSEETKDGS